MQPGQAGRRQDQQAQQAAIQGELQAQQARLAHQRHQQRSRRRQAGDPDPPVPDGTGRAASPPVLWPQASSRKRRAKRAAAWGVSALVVFWAIVIATHVEWVRLHDGTVTPISYSLAVVISVLVAVLLLIFYALSARPAEGGINKGGNTPQQDGMFRPATGLADGAMASPARGADPGPGGLPATAGGDTAQQRTQSVETITGDGEPSLLVTSSSGQQRRMPIPRNGLVLGRRDQLGPPFSTDDLVSRDHASIRRYGDGLVEVADLGSTNGTYINGKRVNAPTPMSSSDVLRLGHIELRLEPDRDTVTGSAVKTPAEEQILNSARAAYASKDLQASAEGFSKLVKSPACAADASYGLGMVALAQGRRQEAEKLFEACLRADRTYANAWYQLGQLKEPQSPAEAQRCYQEALRLNPQHAGALRKLGTARGATVTQPTVVPGPPSAPSLPANRGPAAYASPGAGDADQWFADAPIGHIRGRVVGFQRRAEQSFYLHRLYLYVWDFRVERPGMAPVMVEMRGFRFRGDISNGDIVDIVATDASPGQVLKVRRLVNLTTNAEITTSYGRGPRTLAVVSKTAGRAIILAVAVIIIIFVIHLIQSANG